MGNDHQISWWRCLCDFECQRSILFSRSLFFHFRGRIRRCIWRAVAVSVACHSACDRDLCERHPSAAPLPTPPPRLRRLSVRRTQLRFFPVSFVALPLCSLRCCQIPSDEVAALSRSCPTWCGTVGQISDICTRYEKHKKSVQFLTSAGVFFSGACA